MLDPFHLQRAIELSRSDQSIYNQVNSGRYGKGYLLIWSTD